MKNPKTDEMRVAFEKWKSAHKGFVQDWPDRERMLELFFESIYGFTHQRLASTPSGQQVDVEKAFSDIAVAQNLEPATDEELRKWRFVVMSKLLDSDKESDGAFLLSKIMKRLDIAEAAIAATPIRSGEVPAKKLFEMLLATIGNAEIAQAIRGFVNDQIARTFQHAKQSAYEDWQAYGVHSGEVVSEEELVKVASGHYDYCDCGNFDVTESVRALLKHYEIKKRN